MTVGIPYFLWFADGIRLFKISGARFPFSS